MARKEFDRAEDEPDSEVMDQIDGAVADDEAVAARQDLTLGAVTGDASAAGLRLPRLQIAYGVGKLAKEYTPGDLVLGGDNLLVHKKTPLHIIILHVDSYWKEYVSNDLFQSGVRPRVFQSLDQVRKAGGRTEWANGQGPDFSPAMDLKMLIQQPEGVICGLFGIAVGDKQYAPAVWSVDKTAYRRIAPLILTCAKFTLAVRGVHSALFELSTDIEDVGGNNTPVPSIKMTRHLKDEEVAEIAAMFTPTHA
ncbi:MAG TPA: hypothetical protein VM141_12430 [Planctomycetota bacterium]|nr:hypothetical protein [Planctomycetota bacterium]